MRYLDWIIASLATLSLAGAFCLATSAMDIAPSATPPATDHAEPQNLRMPPPEAAGLRREIVRSTNSMNLAHGPKPRLGKPSVL
jgi:hypothetical protein